MKGWIEWAEGIVQMDKPLDGDRVGATVGVSELYCVEFVGEKVGEKIGEKVGEPAWLEVCT